MPGSFRDLLSRMFGWRSAGTPDAIAREAAQGRQGISVVQPQSGTDYPLVWPSEDIRYLLADFYLEYVDPADYATTSTATALPEPFRIRWLYGIGTQLVNIPKWFTPQHEASIRIVAADDRLVFDSNRAHTFRVRDWGPRLRIYEWYDTDYIASAAICRLVIHTGWPADGSIPPREYPCWLVPERAIIDSRCVRRKPRQVLSLGGGTAPIRLIAGHNIEFEVSETQSATSLPTLTKSVQVSQRHGTQIVIHVRPGRGAGRYPVMRPPADPVLRTINGAAPDKDGRFQVHATDCLSIQPLEQYADGYLELTQDCKPCCDCDKFIATGQFLAKVTTEIRHLSQRIQVARDHYHDIRQRWEQLANCYKAKKLRLLLQPQGCRIVDVAAQLSNTSDIPWTNIAILFECFVPDSVTGFHPKDATIGCHLLVFQPRGGMFYPRVINTVLAGTWPRYVAQWAHVPARKSVWARFRLLFPACENRDEFNTLPTVLKLTIRASIVKIRDLDYLRHPQTEDVIVEESVILDCWNRDWMQIELPECPTPGPPPEQD